MSTGLKAVVGVFLEAEGGRERLGGVGTFGTLLMMFLSDGFGNGFRGARAGYPMSILTAGS